MKIFTKAIASQVIAAILVFVFAYTAVSKFFNFQIFEYTLTQAPLIGEHGKIAAVFLSAVNLLPVILLLIPATRKAGFIYCTALLLFYSGYIIYSLISAAYLPCSCSGIAPWLSWKNHLWTNLFLLLLSVTGMYLHKRIIAITKPVPASTGNRQS
jgi:hypothetical protein